MDKNDDTMLSRAVREKTTIIAPLTIRQTEGWAREVHELAELHGMEKSEYIRYLVAMDKAKQEQIWAARNKLFNSTPDDSTNSGYDTVGRDS